jgi:transcription elongation factor Elf1
MVSWLVHAPCPWWASFTLTACAAPESLHSYSSSASQPWFSNDCAFFGLCISVATTLGRHGGCDGCHKAVALVGCSPNSLTFLNSWGDNGSFNVENHTVLKPQDGSIMNFYDVYWFESDLTIAKQNAYDTKVDEELRRRAEEYPSIFELEYRCPECRENAPLAKFRGNIRRAICPNCKESFKAEPGHLMQVIYPRARLSDVV